MIEHLHEYSIESSHKIKINLCVGRRSVCFLYGNLLKSLAILSINHTSDYIFIIARYRIIYNLLNFRILLNPNRTVINTNLIRNTILKHIHHVRL